MKKSSKKKYPKVAIIIPTLLGGSQVLDCLKSIKALSYPQEKIQIVLIDNNTPDKIYKRARSIFKNIKPVRNKKNAGFAKSVNQGIKKVSCPLYFVTNDDIVFEKNSLKTLIDYALENKNVGIIGGKQLDATTGKFRSGGKNFNFFTGLQYEKKHSKIPEICDTVEGCSMLIKNSTIKKIGYFDENYFPAYCEDLDYCTGAKRQGVGIFYHPKAIFYHRVNYTVSTFPLSQIYFMTFKNKLRFMIKNAKLYQLLTFVLFHYLLAIPYRMIFLDEPILKPQIKAIIWNLKNLNKTIEQREW